MKWIQLNSKDFGISKWKEADIDIPHEYQAIHYVHKEMYEQATEKIVYDAKFDIKYFHFILFPFR